MTQRQPSNRPDAPYLLLLGANMSLRERSIVGALRVFPGPIATMSPSRDTPAGRHFDLVLDGEPSDPASALAAVQAAAAQIGAVPAGVVPFADGYLRAGWAIADHFGLPYLSFGSVWDSSINKGRMKDRFAAAGVATPRHVELEDLDGARSAARQFGYPCVIKPAAFGGSLGVTLVRDEAELESRFAYVREIIERNAPTFSVPSRSILVEEYCRLSKEVSVEVFNHGDRRAVLAVTDKSLGPAPFFAEMGHVVPSRYTEHPKVRAVAVEACAALGLDRGFAHVEVRFEDDQPPQVIEVGARTAGDGIPDLMEAALGLRPYELHVQSYLDQLDGFPAEPQPLGVAALAVIKAVPGRITEVREPSRLDPAVTSFEVHAAAGRLSEVPQSYIQREGYVQCWWPNRSPDELGEGAHLDIADDLARQLFVVEPVA